MTDRIEFALMSIAETLKEISESLKAFAPVALDKPDATVPYTDDEMSKIYHELFQGHETQLTEIEDIGGMGKKYRAHCDRCRKKTEWMDSVNDAVAELECFICRPL